MQGNKKNLVQASMQGDIEGYRQMLLRVTETIEKFTQGVIDEYECENGEGAKIKDLPAQLLKLVQLIEKTSQLLQQIQPEESVEPAEIHYEIIRQYLERRPDVD